MSNLDATPAPDDDGLAVDRAVRVAALLDLYGPLLTDRQREFIRLHYEDDLSFGEIAREYGISRQAIHDAVKHAEKALAEYDAKLQLSPRQVAARRRAGDPAPEPAASAAPPAAPPGPAPIDGIAPVLAQIESIIERLRRSGGVLYNVDGVTRELEAVAARLRELGGAQ
jgi:predicted DNA-binding protein YlxM (UPF0122 family)